MQNESQQTGGLHWRQKVRDSGRRLTWLHLVRLLKIVGMECPGAVQVLEEGAEPPDMDDVDGLVALTDAEIAMRLREVGMRTLDLLPLRISSNQRLLDMRTRHLSSS